MTLGIETRGEDDRAVVAVRGELDAHTAPQLDFELARLTLLGCARIVLDLTRVDLIDSTGLRALVLAHNRCLDDGGHLVLTNPKRIVLTALDVTGLRDVLRVQP